MIFSNAHHAVLLLCYREILAARLGSSGRTASNASSTAAPAAAGPWGTAAAVRPAVSLNHIMQVCKQRLLIYRSAYLGVWCSVLADAAALQPPVVYPHAAVYETLANL
jgi:hypothetical protein